MTYTVRYIQNELPRTLEDVFAWEFDGYFITFKLTDGTIVSVANPSFVKYIPNG